MVFDEMALICLHFKWLGFRNADPIQNPDHLQPNLFVPFKIQTSLEFRFSLYVEIFEWGFSFKNQIEPSIWCVGPNRLTIQIIWFLTQIFLTIFVMICQHL